MELLSAAALRSRLRLLTGLALVFGIAQAGESIQSAGEYELKAAFLYNFAKFIEWPASSFNKPDSAFLIGIVGNDPFGTVLDQVLKGQNWNGRPIAIARFRAPEDIRPVQILFVSESERRRWPNVQASVGTASVLTVSDMKNFCDLGGIIQFRIEGHKLGFEMNLAAAASAQLVISSKLLKLATAVDRGKQ